MEERKKEQEEAERKAHEAAQMEEWVELRDKALKAKAEKQEKDAQWMRESEEHRRNE